MILSLFRDNCDKMLFILGHILNKIGIYASVCMICVY